MNSETKQCQNCKKDFVVEPEDFNFYEKMQVPPPTWCPQCRAQRRLAFRNDRIFYKRKSDYSGKEIFSRFSDTSPVKVYEEDVWNSDLWDGTDYAMDVDFSKPLLSQLRELLGKVPLLSRSVIKCINSDYSGNCTSFKNCYFCFGGNNNDDCSYCNSVSYSKNCFDILFGGKCELCYESFQLNRCSRTLFSNRCDDCMDVLFSTNLHGCNNCFGCSNLRNKNFYIFNVPFAKDEYIRKISEFDLGSYKSILEIRAKANDFWEKSINKYIDGMKNNDVSGEYIFNSKNTKYSYLVLDGENIKYSQYLRPGPNKDCYDVSIAPNNGELLYEGSTVGIDGSNLKFNVECFENAQDLEYCMYCRGNISHLFACVGLKSKKYCILNKQYTKDEYEALVPKIINHMNKMPYADKLGRIYKYGEFFPIEFSPFAYNDTIAQEYFLLTKEQAIKQGYNWKDSDKRAYTITKTSDQLPDNIKDIDDSILKDTIQCLHNQKCDEQCTQAFKITIQELQFYKKINLPIPRLCPNCRYYQRMAQRNPLKLWHRQCMCDKKHPHHTGKCSNEFETSYAPERKEIVYCEQCYQQEVV